MSYILVDKNGKVADFSSNGGMDELLAGPPSLLQFLEDGGSDDYADLIKDLQGTPFEHIADMLKGMEGEVIISNGIEEDDDAKDYHAEHDQQDHGNWAREGGTESPAFKKWFGDSKVVDSDGKPLAMYHGTYSDFDSFRPYQHFGTAAAANQRADNLEGFDRVVGREQRPYSVMPVYLSIQNPIRMPDMASLDSNTGKPLSELDDDEKDSENFSGPRDWDGEEAIATTLYEMGEMNIDEFEEHRSNKDALQFLKDKGYDGIVYENYVEDAGHDSWVIFDPSQVKSKFNKGTYDPSDKRISFHQPDNPDHDQESHGSWADGSSGKTPEQQKKAKKATVRGEVDAAAMAANVDEDALAEAFAVQHEDFNTEARFEVTGTVDEDVVREDLRDQARENIDRDELVQSLAESARENIDQDELRKEIESEVKKELEENESVRERVLYDAGLRVDAPEDAKADAFNAWMDSETDDRLESRINEMVDREVNDNIESEFDSAVDQYVENNFVDALDTAQSNADDQEITVHGKILDKNGNKAGDFTREIKLGERSVYHAYFFLGKDYQSKGIARDLLESSVRFYDQIGIDNVTVTANGDVGKYAWAVYGFDFDDSYTLHNKREGLLDTIQTKYRLEWEQLGEAGRLALTNQIRSLKHSWDIATFKLGNEKVGKDYLLHSSDWSGRLDLNGDGRKIFDAYIKRSKSKPVEDPNQMKLPFAKKEQEFGDQDSVIVHKDILDLEDEMYEIIAKLFPIGKYERHYEDIQFRRPLSKYESRVNFARANDAFTRLISETDVKLRDALRKSQKAIIKRATDAINVLNPSLAATFNVDVGDEFYRIFRDFLLDAWRDGKDQAFDELPERVKQAARQVKQFHYPGGEDHDQSTHGNWAHGGGFYSPLSRSLENAKQASAPASDWISIISKAQGVTKSELSATSVIEYLKAKGSEKVTKEELLAFAKENAVEIAPVFLGNLAGKGWVVLGWNDDGTRALARNANTGEEREFNTFKEADEFVNGGAPTKFGQYTLPGGENYREMLLTLPEKDWADLDRRLAEARTPEEHDAVMRERNALAAKPEFKSGHFEQSNIVAHLRMDDRVDADGNKILFLEEIQSDWAQQGRSKGFTPTDAERLTASDGIKAIRLEQQKFEPGSEQWDALDEKILPLARIAGGNGNIPPAPFVTDTKEWVGLAMKHAIVEAVKGGYDAIAWTTGEQQADRYSLAKHVDAIHWENIDGQGNQFEISIKQPGESRFGIVYHGGTTTIPAKDLPDYIGKELADKVIAQARSGDRSESGDLAGEGLKVGGEGMKSFYDSIVPSVAGKIIRKSDPAAKIAKIKMVFKQLNESPYEYGPDGKRRDRDFSREQQGFYITPYMREQIRKGVALFESDDDARVYHGDGSHDDKSHGNWADGGGAPWTQTREEFYVNNVFRAPGTSLLEQAYKLEALPDDAELWTYLATDRATADKFLAEGIDPEQKPMNLARWRLEHGEDGVEFAPGRGLAGGTYVGGTPQDVSGYGRTILAIRTTKGKLETTPEAEALGNKNGAHALSVNDAQIKGKIAASNIVEIADNRYPGSGHEELVRAALRAGKYVPDKVLADYPDLKKFHADHDQKSHGNWATDSSTSNVKEPWEMTKAEWLDYKLPTAKPGNIMAYHRLRHAEQLESVLKEGLLLSKKNPGFEGPANTMWAANSPTAYSEYGTVVGFEIPEGDAHKVAGDQFMIYRDIKPEEIVFVDREHYAGAIGSLRIGEVRRGEHAKEAHRYLIEKALSEGKTVSSKVLDDYPDLKAGNYEYFQPKRYAGFEPVQAINYLTSKALVIKGLLDNELTEDFRILLLEHLKGGRTLSETIMDLRELFEPWIGDPTKVAPSGQVGINTPPGTKSPDNLLQAYRLENMIRTPIIEAYNQGRLAIGDAADDYVIGYEYSALLDTRTTEICLANDGLLIRKDDPRLIKLTPPVHYQCRSLLVYVTIDDTPVEWSDDEELDAAVSRIQEGFA